MIYEKILGENKAWAEETLDKINKKLSVVVKRNAEKIPFGAEADGMYIDTSDAPLTWTNGFWPGMLWLMYNRYGNPDYKTAAEWSEKVLDGGFARPEKTHHDTGFIWHISSGVNYRLTGNEESKKRNLLAAMILASRYNCDGNFIRAWPREDAAGWTIIDCMMNLPQLYWASEVTGDDRFKRFAMHQADMSMRDHVREDGSVNHIVSHDLDKKDTVIETFGGQGYAVGSCWSRGLSWAVYGFIISYRYTGKKEYLETSMKTANYFIENAKKTNYLPLLDFNQPPEPVYYDSSAGAVTACGLIDLAKTVEDESLSEYYLTSAIKMLKAMDEAWCDYRHETDNILTMSSASYKGKKHINVIYGDYYFIEALLKLAGSEFTPW